MSCYSSLPSRQFFELPFISQRSQDQNYNLIFEIHRYNLRNRLNHSFSDKNGTIKHVRAISRYSGVNSFSLLAYEIPNRKGTNVTGVIYKIDSSLMDVTLGRLKPEQCSRVS